MSEKSGTSSQIISLPKGGGAIKGIGETFQPNLFTGTGNFSIPIATSPGRAGFGPQLTLQYSTGNGNGPFGLGWQLSIPRITRKTEKGLPKYDRDDIFVMSGAEDLVPCLQQIEDPDQADQKMWVLADPVPRGDFTATRYRPRTEGLFARIEQWVHNTTEDVHWRATTKDNVTSIYGRTHAARIADPKNPTHVYEWLLEETYDAKGNHILYEYARDDPDLDLRRMHEENRSYCQRYIRRIYYGNLPDPLEDESGDEITYGDQDQTKIGYQRTGTDHREPGLLTDRRYAFEIFFDYWDWDLLPFRALGDRKPADRLEAPSLPLARGDTDQELLNQHVTRPDPFSSFRSGFEVRTLRRCRRVLMIHHFKELGGPTVVRSTDFEYETNLDTHVSFLTQATVAGYRRDGDAYITTSMPPLTFKYSEFRPHEQRYQSLTAQGNDLPPLALNNPDFALVDLNGNGLPDILHTAPTGFRYWQNLGNGTLDRPQSMPQVPAGVTLSQPGVSFADMAGDGRADLLVLSGPVKGFYETTPDSTWETFKRFDTDALPSFDLADPNVRLLDVTGDGLTDVLMTRDHHFLWFECLGEKGYAKPQCIERAREDDELPDVYFNDPSGRVRLADMTGDGLNDIVLLHNGRVDYWPNKGYGEFGQRITMARSPRLEYNYDPARLFLADLDGSGCADLVYVDFDQVCFWFNRSGNGWSDARVIPGTPAVTNAAAIQFADIYGHGTAALVWSYDYNRQPEGNYKALDLCGGVKPYLLVEMDNRMGATTRVRYRSSTHHCLEDEANGEPWATRLPFPVQVVDKVEVIDHVSKTKLVTTYEYHHGYFDGRERDFRGFGRVDQYDTEVFEEFSGAGLHGDEGAFANQDQAYHVPPVLTKNWFHTGIYYERLVNGQYQNEDTLLARYGDECYQGDPQVFSQGKNVVEAGDTPHEAFRALRGAALRSEVYALDGVEKQDHPYMVTESRYRVRQVQPKEGNNHGVYLTTSEETLTYHYERDPADPRIGHEITLKVDEHGNVTDRVSIGYPRRRPAQPFLDNGGQPIVDDNGAPIPLFEEQRAVQAMYTFTLFINEANNPGHYYIGVPCETRAFEIHGLPWDWPAPDQPPVTPLQPLRRDDLMTLDDVDDYAPYQPDPPEVIVGPVKRIVEWTRSHFLPDAAAGSRNIALDSDDYPVRDLANRLPLCQLESLALPYESYQAALTQPLIDGIFKDPEDSVGGTVRVSADMLRQAGYHHEDGVWWIPSGQQGFEPVAFFRPVVSLDPFAAETEITYDAYALLPVAVQDELDNRTEAANDYRVLQPARVTDPNGNHALVAFDALGLVAGTAVQSKDGEGDTLDGFQADLPPGTIRRCLADPLGRDQAPAAGSLNPVHDPHDVLRQASTRLLYDLWACADHQAPATVYTMAREHHFRSKEDGHLRERPVTPVQHSFLYSDGFGREVQTKIQAEPGPTPKRDPVTERIIVQDGQVEMSLSDADPRWVGSGWTIYNNKGKPVRQFEPYFSDRHVFEFDVQIGVSPTPFYDPLERVVATLHPNHTWEKVVFDPWRQETWDVNDTVTLNPRSDKDVKSFFINPDGTPRLQADEYLPTWYDRRTDPAKASQAWPDTDAQGQPLPANAKRRAAEKSAADKAADHADTPAVAHLDTLGRTFLTVADDGTPDKVKTHVRLDIEGNDRIITDPRGIQAFKHTFDLAGRKLVIDSVDAGHRCVLVDVVGQPLYSWDDNRNQVYTGYDKLRRPEELWVRREGETEFYLAQKTIYGEAVNDPPANLRGQVWRQYDGAGLAEDVAYDFKGNLLQARRTLLDDGRVTEMAWDRAADPRQAAAFDANAAAQNHLEQNDGYLVTTAYDALNRVTRSETSDKTVQEPVYNQAGLLESLKVTYDGQQSEYVQNVSYDEKGRRTCIAYGNGVTTEHSYDRETFRLTHIVSYRQGRSKDDPDLQDLNYTYYPAGNITEIRDDVHPVIFNHNNRIEAASQYCYDPLYRLQEARGREHEDMTPCHYDKGAKKQTEFIALTNQPLANGRAICNYTRSYTYDKSGNLTRVHHHNRTLNRQWTRYQDYETGSNRILSSQAKEPFHDPAAGLEGDRLACPDEALPPAPSPQIEHDRNGNITRLPHLQHMTWNFRDQLVAAQLQVGVNPDRAYYQYDAGGQRVRKMVVKGATTEERIYLGSYEIFRRFVGTGREKFRRVTVHVMDDRERIALIEHRKIDQENSEAGPPLRIRYQLTNHLGSAAVEVGETIAAIPISYEEYYPYGGTAYIAHLAGGEYREATGQKRYRYSGKERDDETGFYYYGARYYAPWLGRWANCDPIGLKGGLNIYRFVRNNPIVQTDVAGTKEEPAKRTLVQGEAQHIVGSSDLNSRMVTAMAAEKEAVAAGDLELAGEYNREWQALLRESIHEKQMFLMKFSAIECAILGAGVIGFEAAILAGGGILTSSFIGSSASIVTEQGLRIATESEPLSPEAVGDMLAIGTLLPAAFEAAPVAIRLLRSLLGRTSRAQAKVAVVNASAEKVISPEIGNWVSREDVGKKTLEPMLGEEGMLSMPSQFPNNTGLDDVYVSLGGAKAKIFEHKGLMNYEARDIKRALSALKQTKTMGRQMSLEYVYAQTSRLARSSSATLRETGTALGSAQEIERYLVVLDEYGNLHIYDLSFYEMLLW